MAATHASSYFLLADDQPLVAQAAEHSMASIFGTGLFGFYRPLGFVVVKLAGFFASSDTGRSLVVLSVHAVNSALLALLATRLGYPPVAAAVASALFLWSPWSSEAYLWVSAIFDVGTAFGILVAVSALTTKSGSLARNATAVALGVAGCLIAAGFKENGYLAAALVPAIVLSGFRQSSYRRIALTALLAAGCAAGIFLYRSSLLSATSTPYNVSEFAGRLLSMSAVPSAASSLRGLLLWPVPAVWADLSRLLAVILVWPLGAALTAGMVVLALAGRTRAWLLLVALAVSVAPTAFYQIAVQTITPRRYLYLAGVPLCLLVGSAIAERQQRRDITRSPGSAMAMAGLLLAAALAGTSQVKLWALVTTTARCALGDFGKQVLDSKAMPIYVENMPFAVDHGPFILLEYDFTYAYRQRWQGADVAFRRTLLTLGTDGLLAVQGYGEGPQDVARRKPISLDLCLGQRP